MYAPERSIRSTLQLRTSRTHPGAVPLQRQRTPRAIDPDQPAIAAADPPIDLGVLIGLHVEQRNLVEFATIDVGRDRIDHRIPAVAGFGVGIGRSVVAPRFGLL